MIEAEADGRPEFTPHHPLADKSTSSHRQYISPTKRNTDQRPTGISGRPLSHEATNFVPHVIDQFVERHAPLFFTAAAFFSPLD